ncbi:antibiotic biosynthesis monooxygenase family protein [Elioraea rosea]|uniref:antibiotic biosynthesis monooxygenase family protein n=1 Tax=Elioraea rosea TaxID=2492390 RepID=UPI0011841CC4|nr:antibiotic biosynthesis monooxygenase [Elioraea rosea]
MFAVIFEVRPRPDRWERYLAIARMLRPELERIEGFVENTRYRSDTREGLLLSLSLWRDEKALIRWRTHAGHFAAQGEGRAEVLDDYRLRVGEVAAIRGEGAAPLPAASRLDVTETGEATALALVAGGATMPGALVKDRFTAILEPHEMLSMGGYATLDGAVDAIGEGTARRLAIRIIRDYGMLDRREAPQFHPPVRRSP